MKKKFIKCIQKFLKRPDIDFSDEIPMFYYIQISYQRMWMLLRGLIRSLLLGRRGKRLFIGRRVKLICPSYISVGDCVSIQDDVLINALSRNGVSLGNNVSIGPHTIIKTSGSLTSIGKGFSIGDYSTMGDYCYVGAAGGVDIGNYVAIGQNVRFHSENHEYREKNIKICEQGTTHKGISIGDDCWIGAGAVFLDGARIGNGCVVGANAVITHEFSDYSVIAGIPAKVIDYRK